MGFGFWVQEELCFSLAHIYCRLPPACLADVAYAADHCFRKPDGPHEWSGLFSSQIRCDDGVEAIDHGESPAENIHH